jgi:diguanylate cyclase (GGDEF)-like protein/PAS domain S-box-containing protein
MNRIDPKLEKPTQTDTGTPTIARLERRLKREKAARKEAELLLTQKSGELYKTLRESQRLQHGLQVALWGSGDYLWEWTAEHDTIQISEIEDPNAPIQTNKFNLIDFFQTVHPNDLHMVMMEWNSHLFGQSEAFDAQFRVKRGDEWHWLRMRGQGIDRDERKLAPTVAGTLRNISEQQQDRRNLELLVNAFDNTSEGMCILSAHRQIIDSNRAFNEFFGLAGMQLSGRSLDTFFDESQLLAINLALDVASETGEWQGEYELADPFGEVSIPTWLSINAMQENEALSYFVLSAIDISERKQAEEALQNLANFDSLTQLSNRGFFETRLNDSIEQAKRNQSTLALLFVDLDRFKQINDTMGHKAGDDLLTTLASRLQSSVRKSDLVGRWGGDEFVVLLNSLATPNDAYRVADKIREAVLEPMTLSGVTLTVSTSIGVALFPQDADNKEDLLDRADAAMYQAKSSGRNKVGCYEQGMSTTTNEKLMLEVALRNAIANNELILHYQPKICLQDRKVKSVEALIRWISPQHGFVSPADFIPLAEESGLILEIGDWVLKTACEQIARWQGTQFEDLHVAVNVSANQLRQPDLVSNISNLLSHNNVAPEKLEIELTESCLLTDVDKMTALFRQMRGMGLSIAIDDFGTGYSSLAYLKDLPITTLKVDRAFVSQIGVDPKGEAVVRTIVMLAQNLDLKVVAEGVETEEQDAFLKHMGCDDGQGYLYFKPMNIEDLEQSF